MDVTDLKPETLIAIETMGGGGAERVVLDLVRHWPRDHSTPVLLVASRRGEYLCDLPPDVTVLEVGVPSSPRATISFLRRLRRLVRGRNIEGVISHMTGMNRMMLRAQLAGIIRAPVVVVEHNDFLRDQQIAEMPWPRAFLLQTETGFLYRRAHAVVGCSQGVTSQVGALFSIAPGRLHAIANPLDRRFLLAAEMDKDVSDWFDKLSRPVLVSVGRMVPQKAFDDLIRAFAKLSEGSLVILGNGPLRPELESLARALGVFDRVVMPGFMSCPEQVLQAADLYVSSSLWEGYPLTLVEAYASGLPVIARDCNFGPVEIVRPNRPGALVSADGVDALASAIRQSLASEKRFPPGTVVDLAQNAPEVVVGFYCNLFREAK